MIKKILGICLALFLLLPTLARQEGGYESIQMSDSLAALCAAHGPLTPDENGMVDLGEVLCRFYESGRLWGKVRAFENIGEVAMRVEGDFAAARKLHMGESLASVQALLGGEGTEIARLNLSDEENSGVQLVLAWQNGQGEVLEALFEQDDGEWVLFAVAAIA